MQPTDKAAVRKDKEGKVTTHNEMASGTEAGATVGAVLGGLLFVVFPLAGIAAGAAVGGLIGRAAAPGIDGTFVRRSRAHPRPAARHSSFRSAKASAA